MAYSISPGAILQLTCRYALVTGTDEALTTHHFVYSGPAITDGALEARTAAQEWMTVASRWAQLWKVTASDLVGLHDVWGQWIHPIRYQKQDAALPTVFGTQSVPPAPPGTSVALERRGDIANRHGVGGVRVPATNSTINDAVDGLILAGQRPAWQALADSMNDSWSTASTPGGTFTPIIYNRAAPSASVIVTQGILHLQIRTMRRRVVGRGS
jgi:hypothetical protein